CFWWWCSCGGVEFYGVWCCGGDAVCGGGGGGAVGGLVVGGCVMCWGCYWVVVCVVNMENYEGARHNEDWDQMHFEARAEWSIQSKPMGSSLETHGLSTLIFAFLQNTEGLQQDGPKTLTKQSSRRCPSVIPHLLIFVTPPLSQQGFPLCSSTNQAGPSQNHDVGVVNRDEMLDVRERLSQATIIQLAHSPCVIDLNSPVLKDLVYMGSHDTDGYISLHNVDPNKVVRNQYVDCMTFLGSPKPVFLDCGIKGFVVEEQFWRDLVLYVCVKGDRPPGARYTVAKTGTSAMIEKSNKFVIETDFHLMGMLDGSSRPYPSWDDVDIVYMPINSGGDHWVTGVLNLRWSTIHVIDSLNNPHRKKQLMDHISKWTNVLNVLLEKAGHFERTGRQPYNFELVYNDGLEFASPQQGNSSDCGVVTCWVIESLFMGRAPVLYNVDPNFFFSDFRVQMCLRLYNCRCEDTQECGYD
ncbi:phospholipase-like protein, partial [Tanacetum coccineum]